MDMTAITMQATNTCQDTEKLPESPVKPTKLPTNDQIESRNRAGMPNTRIWLETHEIVSTAQQTRNGQIYLVVAQSRVQMKRIGLRAGQAC